MRKTLLLLSVWSCLVLLVAWQDNTSIGSKIVKRLSQDKPSVFLTFERADKRKIACLVGETVDVMLIRLHNNLTSPIGLAGSINIADQRNLAKLTRLRLTDGTQVDGLSDGAEVEVCYEVEAIPTTRSVTKDQGVVVNVPVETEVPAQSLYCNCRWRNAFFEAHSSGILLWVPSGSSIIFSVPTRYLMKNLSVYTMFNYEWETKEGLLSSNEPRHQIYFYSYNLPSSFR